MTDTQPQQEVVEEDLRRRIKYYFMNPCEKFDARGRKPWKLMLQIIKICIITIQLVYFGLSNQMVVTFKEENLMAFRHLFLKDYVDVDDNAATYSLYRQGDVYEHIHFIIKQYGLLGSISVGNHAYEKNGAMSLCQEYYTKASVFPGNYSFDIDAQIKNECFHIVPMYPQPEGTVHPGFIIHFKRMISIKITFVLKTINLQTVRHRELPDCYDFTVMITFNNRAHSGKIKVDLDTDVEIKECRKWKITGASGSNLYLALVFDCFIITTCIMSFTLCTRSVLNGIRLQSEYVQYCKKHKGRQVPCAERMDFISGWYLLIITSDTLTITGSTLKIAIQTKSLSSYDVCSIFLGTGTMFVWIGVIRYLGYFKKYNILILTLRAALPNVIRFVCCAGIIYLSYCFCGWIVLGPYHDKFRTLNMVSECLFSLINGDDMFKTFKHMQHKNQLVWLFSRVYLYTFVSLFIYMVLSLFITLITDTYDTIKQQQEEGSPTSELQRFMSMCKDLPSSGAYRVEEKPNCLLACCFPGCQDDDDQLISEG